MSLSVSCILVPVFVLLLEIGGRYELTLFLLFTPSLPWSYLFDIRQPKYHLVRLPLIPPFHPFPPIVLQKDPHQAHLFLINHSVSPLLEVWMYSQCLLEVLDRTIASCFFDQVIRSKYSPILPFVWIETDLVCRYKPIFGLLPFEPPYLLSCRKNEAFPSTALNINDAQNLNSFAEPYHFVVPPYFFRRNGNYIQVQYPLSWMETSAANKLREFGTDACTTMTTKTSSSSHQAATSSHM